MPSAIGPRSPQSKPGASAGATLLIEKEKVEVRVVEMAADDGEQIDEAIADAAQGGGEVGEMPGERPQLGALEGRVDEHGRSLAGERVDERLRELAARVGAAFRQELAVAQAAASIIRV